MLRRTVAAVPVVLTLMLVATGCALRPAAPPVPPEDRCADADGPSPETVQQAVQQATASVSGPWTQAAAGHTRDCRLHWVKLTLPDAMADSPEQLLFFDHDTPLGSPTPDPKPYTTVLSAGTDTVTVQYQWRVDSEPSCCPTGVGTTRYRISHGKLAALDPIPGPR